MHDILIVMPKMREIVRRLETMEEKMGGLGPSRVQISCAHSSSDSSEHYEYEDFQDVYGEQTFV